MTRVVPCPSYLPAKWPAQFPFSVVTRSITSWTPDLSLICHSFVMWSLRLTPIIAHSMARCLSRSSLADLCVRVEVSAPIKRKPSVSDTWKLNFVEYDLVVKCCLCQIRLTPVKDIRLCISGVWLALLILISSPRDLLVSVCCFLF